MPPLPLRDQVHILCDLTSMLRMAVDPDVPNRELVLDRMRRLDEVFQALREAVSLWAVQQELERTPDQG